MEENNILNQLGTDEETKEPKDKTSSTTNKTIIDDDVIKSMMANGDNSKGMFNPDEESIKDKDEKLHEDVDKKAEIKIKGEAIPSDKYKDKFTEDMQKNPDKYFVETPRGKMSIKEATEKGFDPRTKRFNLHEKQQKHIDELLTQVNDKDREGIKRMMDPSQLGLAPADAEGLGISPDSKMVKHNVQEEVPQEQAPSQEQQTMPDLTALLGGK